MKWTLNNPVKWFGGDTLAMESQSQPTTICQAKKTAGYTGRSM